MTTQKRKYFNVGGVPVEAIVQYSGVSAKDPRLPDGATSIVAGYNNEAHMAYDIPEVPLDARLGDARYTKDEYDSKYGRYVDGEGNNTTEGADDAMFEHIIQPDAWSPARNADKTLTDEYLSSPFWSGPDAWTLRDGVREISEDEYLTLVNGK